MKILSVKQSREGDNYTIANEPISSVDLMERAAKALAHYLAGHFSENTPYRIYCGKGNNGGDGLALARLLCGRGCNVTVVILELSESASPDFTVNFERLGDTKVKVIHWHSIEDWDTPDPQEVIVDAILGSGLSRPLDGWLLELVRKLNAIPNYKIAVDIPSGLFGDDNTHNHLHSVLKSDLCLTFQSPKLAMLHRNTALFCGDLHVLDIGIHADYLEQIESRHYFLTPLDAKAIFKPRLKFSYKGTYGHGLLLAGGRGSVGAAVMSASASLRSGIGLLTVAAPSCALIPLQTHLPEAMVVPDVNEECLTTLPDLDKYNAAAIGPGIGTARETALLLKELLSKSLPLVLDADALNILAANGEWLDQIPQGSILTPHIGEFRRLLGVENLGDDYLEQLSQLSSSTQSVIILKDAISTIAAPNGMLYFADFGSPALASPGSGDVLTGILLALLNSGYSALEAAQLGVYLHGRAGRIAGERQSLEAALASDVINALGTSFRELY